MKNNPMPNFKILKAQLALIPFVLIILLIVYLLSSCQSAKYVTNSNFYKLERGMSEQAFLDWIKPNYVANNGRPTSVKMFNYEGKEWKVYVFDIYRISGSMAFNDHKEYAAFVNGRLEEYGTGDLPITIRQNPNQYTIISR